MADHRVFSGASSLEHVPIVPTQFPAKPLDQVATAGSRCYSAMDTRKQHALGLYESLFFVCVEQHRGLKSVVKCRRSASMP